jgi:hypothetical protein
MLVATCSCVNPLRTPSQRVMDIAIMGLYIRYNKCRGSHARKLYAAAGKTIPSLKVYALSELSPDIMSNRIKHITVYFFNHDSDNDGHPHTSKNLNKI